MSNESKKSRLRRWTAINPPHEDHVLILPDGRCHRLRLLLTNFRYPFVCGCLLAEPWSRRRTALWLRRHRARVRELVAKSRNDTFKLLLPSKEKL